ncbi:MAG: hypothetical protein D8M58_17955 [Calditrichaeota bacterium]|nr:hypothetical protein [Calditrichota bacterium]
MAVSAQKYVKAVASINLRTHARISDVDEAFRFIQTKVDFLKIYLVKTKTHSFKQHNITSEDRWQLIEKEFVGREFKRKEVIVFYEENKIYVNSKTVDRDLMKATKVRQGIYRIK